MTATTLKDAREHLDELVHRARQGETVIIRQRGQRPVQLVAVTGAEDLELGVDEARKLNAWAEKERATGNTRVFESPTVYLAHRRAYRAKTKSR